LRVLTSGVTPGKPVIVVPDKRLKAANIAPKKGIRKGDKQPARLVHGPVPARVPRGPGTAKARLPRSMSESAGPGPAGQAFRRSRSSASRRIAAPSVSVRRSFT
jgi:hypothetical protein